MIKLNSEEIILTRPIVEINRAGSGELAWREKQKSSSQKKQKPLISAENDTN